MTSVKMTVRSLRICCVSVGGVKGKERMRNKSNLIRKKYQPIKKASNNTRPVILLHRNWRISNKIINVFLKKYNNQLCGSGVRHEEKDTIIITFKSTRPLKKKEMAMQEVRQPSSFAQNR